MIQPLNQRLKQRRSVIVTTNSQRRQRTTFFTRKSVLVKRPFRTDCILPQGRWTNPIGQNLLTRSEPIPIPHTSILLVLIHWTNEDLQLSAPDQQSWLFVEPKSLKGKHKNVDLSTAIFIEDDDGSVATFTISSPAATTRVSTPITGSLSQRRVDFDLVDGLPTTPKPLSSFRQAHDRPLDSVALQ